MAFPLTSSPAPTDLNLTRLGRYLWLAALLASAAAVYALFNLPLRYLYLAVAAPVSAAIILNPRLALYQFVFVVYLEYLVMPSVPLYLIDLSMGLVVMAGTLDLLLRGGWPRRLPPLSLNYLYIVGAVGLCGLVGFFPELVARRLITTASLLALFWAIYRLSARVPVAELLRLFFGLAVGHSVLVLVPFLTSGGVYRSFGFSGVLFDDQAMVALPIGIGLYLMAPKETAGRYLAGVVAVAGGLVATQSRAPILLGMAASVFVMGAAVRHGRAGKRVLRLVLGGVGALVLLILVQPEIFTTVGERFGELASAKPQGTVVYRLALWKRALTTFLDHPIFGVGPGGYYHLNDIYLTSHLTPHYGYLRTLGAHNVLLHYLADTGLVGGLGLLALVINQFRIGRRGWHATDSADRATALALYGWAILFGLSTLIEANWMWGQLSFLAVFLAALVARHYQQTVRASALASSPRS